MIARPHVDISGIGEFLGGFDPSLGYPVYLDDPTQLPPAELLSKFAGQVCYMSFDAKRTLHAQAAVYFDGRPGKSGTGIKGQKHGSVLEHPSFSFLTYGVSRSLTHELVRHRAGCAYSQLSQRYVGGKMLRFVERPEYVGDPFLHDLFERRIDRAYAEYEGITGHLTELQAAGGRGILSAEAKTELRKKVRQAARSILPNETETVLVVTGNVRAWRHILEMRASEHAETEIRAWAMRVYRCLVQEAPLLFGDYQVVDLPDGTQALSTPYPKV
ncbi:MAG: FAD-dependent thymidylate synthase [Candidatus Yanofskybacteria bacterium]|nr:FAD-dependent thymidylate synthase [Candidatus Yanofskybacteria bacterium]